MSFLFKIKVFYLCIMTFNICLDTNNWCITVINKNLKFSLKISLQNVFNRDMSVKDKHDTMLTIV